MAERLAIGMTVLVAVAAAPVSAASFSYRLKAVVPVHCVVKHDRTGAGIAMGDGLSLGLFREYCNAPQGYQVVVRYTPGSLEGARMKAGEDQVILDGSGYAVLSQTTGPRVRERQITMAPGANGFDTNQLEVDIQPS